MFYNYTVSDMTGVLVLTLYCQVLHVIKYALLINSPFSNYHIIIVATCCHEITSQWFTSPANITKNKEFTSIMGRPEMSTFFTYEITSHNFLTPSPLCL